jgi:hypothetical protein
MAYIYNLVSVMIGTFAFLLFTQGCQSALSILPYPESVRTLAFVAQPSYEAFSTFTQWPSQVSIAHSGLPAVNWLSIPDKATIAKQVPLQSAATSCRISPGSKTVSTPRNVPLLTIRPAVLSGGYVNLMIDGSCFSPSNVVSLDGKELSTIFHSPSSLSAVGYLPPWRSGTSTVAIEEKHAGSTISSLSVPIAPTAVSYDTASRFATQAAFGARHDVIEHIQQIGLTRFIREQMQQPPLTYPSTGNGARWIFLVNAISGNSLLRERVSWALQSFIVTRGIFALPSLIPWQHKMEVDAFGNFRQVLEDAASDASMGAFLDLAGNAASMDPKVHPNQNFARELLQQFSIGPLLLNEDGTPKVDALGKPIEAYDEATILDLSRALTGWSYAPPVNSRYTFYGVDYSQPLVAHESQHDHGAKVLFGSVRLPAGQDTATDRKMAIDAVFLHPNVPPFVSRILIQRLVKSNPSGEYVRRVARVFEDDGHGVRGNLAAVVEAILLDPEARIGDSAPSASDGFLQEPLLAVIQAMALLQEDHFDGQPTYLPGYLQEDFFYPASVFGFYRPEFNIPETKINSPEFSLYDNQTAIHRSQVIWKIIVTNSGHAAQASNYLHHTFLTVPDMVDALNHLLYHGQMPATEKEIIVRYCIGLKDPLKVQLDTAIFLAINGASTQVSH